MGKDDENPKETDEAKDYPPFLCLKGKGGIRIIPNWEKGPDGKWRIVDEDAIKSMLGYGREGSDKK